MLLNRALLFVAALCLGSLLVSLRLPIPFLLAGMICGLLCKTFAAKAQVTWPFKWRECALLVAGYGIGENIDVGTWQNFLSQSMGVLEATLSIFAASILIAFISAKVIREDLASCMLGMFPGGLTLSMLMVEEDKSLDPNIVTVMQVIRLFGVVLSVPFMVIYLLDAKVTGSTVAMPNMGGYHWLIFLPLSLLGAFLARKLHLPTPTLLGTILATAGFAVVCGRVQPVPAWLMAPAQVSIGLFMGLRLDAERVLKAKRAIPCVVLGTAALIAISVGMAHLLSQRYGFTLITAFLAMAPGGTAEMALAGMSMKEDVSIILTYQLVRLLIVNFLGPSALRWALRSKYRNL